MLKKEIFNCETGESIIENLSEQELAVVAQMEIDRLAEIAENERKDAERLKVIEKLGLTPDEIKLLLG